MHGSSSSQSKSSSSEVGIPSWVEHTGGPQKPCLMPNSIQSSKSQFSDMSQSLQVIGIFRNPSKNSFMLQFETPSNHLGAYALGMHLSDVIGNRPLRLTRYVLLLPQHSLIPFITLSMKRTAGLTSSPSSVYAGTAPRFTGMPPLAPESLSAIHPL